MGWDGKSDGFFGRGVVGFVGEVVFSAETGLEGGNR